MNLDIRTIIFIIAVFQALYSIGLLLINRSWIKSYSLNMIALALACGSVGGFLLAYRGLVPDSLSIVLANIFVLGHPVLTLEGIIHLRGIKTRTRIIGPVFILLLLPILSYLTFIEPDLQLRMYVMSAFFGVQSLICAYILARKVDKKFIVPVYSTACVFIFAATIMVFRIVVTALQPGILLFMASGTGQSLLQLSHIVYITGVTFGFIWLNMCTLGFKFSNALRDVEGGLQDQFDFIDILSHELKTPLATIQNSIESVYMRAEDIDSAQEKAFGRIKRSLKRLDNIIEVGLKQKRLVPLQIQNKSVQTSIVELLQTAAEICKGTFPDHKVIVKCDRSFSGEDILADQNSLLTALKNVLENAMKFSPSQKNVYVEISKSASTLIIAVKDKGCGINPENTERLFEKYFRDENTSMTPGSGLGLFIVRHIINAHSGTLSIHNRKSGGCRVDICLPVAGKAMESRESRTDSP